MEAGSSRGLVERWSDWDRFPGGRPFGRPEVEQVLAGLDKQALMELRGCRGVGKSTILRLVAEGLARRGWAREAILYLDLEDPVWAPNPSVQRLDDLLTEAGPIRAVLLDGVERLTGWVDWARTLQARQRVVVAAARTGSLGEDPPPGVSSLDCTPLGLADWINIFTDKKVNNESARTFLLPYLRSGGLPVARKAEGRNHALLDLFFAAMMKDVVLLRPVRDTRVLTAVSVYVLSRSGMPLSASRLKGRHTRSVDQARMFLDHLEAAGLISLVQRLEDVGRSSQAARLCFAADTGLAWALGQRSSSKLQQTVSSTGWGLALTAVFHQFQRAGRPCWAWRHKGRHGLAVGPPEQLDLLVDLQVGQPGALDMGPLAATMALTHCPSGLLLTDADQAIREPTRMGDGLIETRTLWSWLLDPVSTGRSVDKLSTDKKVDIYSGSLPPHLL